MISLHRGVCRFSLVLLGMSLGLTRSEAAPMFYESRGSFDLAHPFANQFGFEIPFDSAPLVSFGEFTVMEDSIGPTISSRADYVSEGVRALGFTWNGSGYIEFRFDAPITAFAVDILDFGTCCGATELIVNSEPPLLAATAAVGENPLRGNQQFFGVASEQPFRALRFSSNVVSDNDLVNFDNLRYQTVPEPPGAVRMALVGWAFHRHRRRGSGCLGF